MEGGNLSRGELELGRGFGKERMEMQDEVQEQLELLNQFTRRRHNAEEVYLFRVKLCDNEIDRDGERFSLEALEQMRALFVGRTGIFDHNPKGENQTARIFSTALRQDPERKTAAGECYTWLEGQAYMIRTEANRDLIREIDGGIKKEVSVSCAAASQVCSVCGKDRRKGGCMHQPGQMYGGKLCHVILSEITDAYEWSFVAVPAQKEAGVTKQFLEEKGSAVQCRMLEGRLREQESMLGRVEQMVRQDIIRLRYLVAGQVEQDAVSAAVKRMNLEELLAFQEKLRVQQKAMCAGQLGLAEKEQQGNAAFRV